MVELLTMEHVACGGCGGTSNGYSLDQSSITSVGGVVGGNSSQNVPSNAITYGSGGCGGYGSDVSGKPAYSGSSGMRGICIILVP